MIKKLLSVVLAACLISTNVYSVNAYQDTAAEAEDDFMTANEFVDNITLGYNIGNSLECRLDNDWMLSMAQNNMTMYETAWGNPAVTQELVDTIKSTGVNTIRIPVTWYQKLDSDGKLSESWLARVKEVVDYIVDEDTYCIINLHHDNGSNGWQRASDSNYRQYSERYANIWKQISDYFKDYDENLIFEGCNKILDENGNWSYTSAEALRITNQYNQLFVDTVRATGGNNAERCLIVNTYAAGITDNILSGFVLPNDTVPNRLIAEVHSYAPYVFCSSDFPNVTELNEEAVVSMLHNVNEYLCKKEIPAILGEFGCVDKNNASEREKYVDLVTRTANKFGIACCVWDNGGDFGLIDRKNNTWKYPDLMQIMLKNNGILWDAVNGVTGTVTNMSAGDVNGDGRFNISDVVLLQKWLLAVPDTKLSDWKAADLCEDNRLNVFDLCMMKRKLLEINFSEQEQSCWTLNSKENAEALRKIAGSTVGVQVNRSGENEDDVTLRYNTNKLSAGSYTLSFYYQAEPDTAISVVIGNQTYSINGTMNEQEFKRTFTWDGNGCIELHLGGHNTQPYYVIFSDFVIQ